MTTTATDYAHAAGAEFCRQIMADTANHQNGAGEFTRNMNIPDEDYRDMTRRFGEVTVEMERAYKSGYNTVAGS